MTYPSDRYGARSSTMQDADDYRPTHAVGDQSKADVAKGQVADVKDTALDAGKNVTATAKDEAANVAGEAKQQAKGLLTNVTSEVKDQAGAQQQKAAGFVASLVQELEGMASASQESGPLTDLARQASGKGSEIAHWLENKEPRDLLDDVNAFARRRPVTFLALCGLAGVVAGRLTRGAVAANTSVDSPKADESATPSSGQLTTGRAPADTNGEAQYWPSAPAQPEGTRPVTDERMTDEQMRGEVPPVGSPLYGDYGGRPGVAR